MAINVSVQYNGEFLPDIVLLTLCYYRREIRSNTMKRFCFKQPIMRIADRLFDRGWVRSAMATRKCGSIYFPKYFMVVRPFLTRIFFQELFGLEG